MTTFQAVLLSATLFVTSPIAMSQDGARKELIERAKSFELNTPYVPPPGDPLEHYAAGYAKIMCSSVFITGLDPAFASSSGGGRASSLCLTSRSIASSAHAIS